MKKILAVDVCVRGEDSRTRRLLDTALAKLSEIHPDWKIERLVLSEEGLSYLDKASLGERDRLIAKRDFEHPRFRCAKQFRDADGILVAAPFWDMSFPALLKVYIENVSVEGLTFYCDEKGLHGMCRAGWMLYLTTRGGIYEEALLQDESYLRVMSGFFGIGKFLCAHADGLDIVGLNGDEILREAQQKTEQLCTDECL